MENNKLFTEIQRSLNSRIKTGTTEIKLSYRDYSPNGVHTGSYDQANQVVRPENESRPSRLIDVLGIRLLKDLTADVTYPLISGNSAQWLEECEAGEINNTAYTSIKLSPRRLFSYAELSNEVAINPNADLQNQVTEDLLASVWEKLERTMINEIYSDEANTINSVADYEDLIALELAAAQANIKNPIYLVSPKAAAKLKGMLNSVFPVYIGGRINNIPVVETPYFENEEIILADWSKLVVGCWEIDITADPITKANVGIIKLIINAHFDFDRLDDSQFIYATTEAADDNEGGEGGGE